jgi:heptaprenyl diphosphate synthase
VLYLRDRARTDPDAADLLTRIERDVNTANYSEEGVDDTEFAAAIAELRAHDVTAKTLTEAHRWAREAVQALEPLPDGPVKKALTRFAESVVERSN